MVCELLVCFHLVVVSKFHFFLNFLGHRTFITRIIYFYIRGTLTGDLVADETPLYTNLKVEVMTISPKLFARIHVLY